MVDFDDICEGIAANLDTIPGLQTSPHMLPNPTTPYAEVVPGDIEYDRAFQRGLDSITFIVRVLVGNVTAKGSQRKLNRFRNPAGDYSIKAAVEADRTLGGLVDDLRVTRAGRNQAYGADQHHLLLGAEWEVEVYASGEA